MNKFGSLADGSLSLIGNACTNSPIVGMIVHPNLTSSQNVVRYLNKVSLIKMNNLIINLN